jgi:DNA helicase-2/ATP-dependent DNA helicase PcrA
MVNKNDNTIDDHIDNEVINYLSLDDPKSFFLFAGAGAGKTRTLVNVLKSIKENHEKQLRFRRQKVAVITYTNNACDEIKHRLGDHNLFYVSTIHSYAWELIRHYTVDIKRWVEQKLKLDIQDLEEKERNGRGGKASETRKLKIVSKKSKLSNLSNIKKFTYNPNGDNFEKHSLNHTDVIGILADFLSTKTLIQRIMISSFPILLIDESQDTEKKLIDAFFEVQKQNNSSFSLGLIGDTMQRIYSSGKEGLGENLPSDWKTPEKKMNHRSQDRIVQLINNIRKDVDNQSQVSRSDKKGGIVRLFLVDQDIPDKQGVENSIAEQMKNITEDEYWDSTNKEYKILTIEHKMAARRGGFINLFDPLYKVDRLKTGLLDGTSKYLRVLTDQILPFIQAKRISDNFEVSRVIKKYSPLLKKENISVVENQIEKIKEANIATKELYSLWSESEPDILTVLKKVLELNLFTLPDKLKLILDDNFEDEGDEIANALLESFKFNFSEIENYSNYIAGESEFETQQGVKGLEYPCVMTIIDDSEAGGFLFSYDKLFKVKKPTASDEKNTKEGRETSSDRTKRLFYVACSRAKESLAVVVYTKNKGLVQETVIKNKWFEKSEIIDY